MKLGSLLQRAGWNLADQMVSSLTNAVLSFMVARAVSAESFGGFSVAFTVFALVIGASRALSTSPLNIRFSDVDTDEARRAAAHASGTALSIGFVSGVGCVVAGLLLPGPTGEALLVMGIVLPAVTTQDSFRYAFFSRGEPKKAALNDIAWAVVQLGAVGALLFAGVSAVGPLVLAWGVSAAAAAFLGTRQAATLPSPRNALSWLREHRDMTGYLIASFATAHGANQGAMLIIAAVGSVRANGALRGGQILLGPVTILGSAAMTFFVPEFSRRRNDLSQRQWMLAAVGVSGVMCFMSFLWGLIFLLMPDTVGQFLLGDTWQATRELLLAAVVAQVLTFGTTGPLVMLFAIDRASSTLLLSFVVGGLTFLGGVGGVLVGGGAGAQWGFAIANALVIPFWYWRLRQELRKRAAEPAVLETPDDADEGSAEATTALAPRRHATDRMMEDFDSTQLATMVLPRIEPSRRRRPPEPATQAFQARPRPRPGPSGPRQFPAGAPPVPANPPASGARAAVPGGPPPDHDGRGFRPGPGGPPGHRPDARNGGGPANGAGPRGPIPPNPRRRPAPHNVGPAADGRPVPPAPGARMPSPPVGPGPSRRPGPNGPPTGNAWFGPPARPGGPAPSQGLRPHRPAPRPGSDVPGTGPAPQHPAPGGGQAPRPPRSAGPRPNLKPRPHPAAPAPAGEPSQAEAPADAAGQNGRRVPQPQPGGGGESD